MSFPTSARWNPGHLNDRVLGLGQLVTEIHAVR